MCSRYFVDLSPELRPIIEAARHSSLAGRMVHDLGRPVITEGEVKPTDIAPVIASNSQGKQSVFPMIWGFRQADRENTKRSRPLINARSETADIKEPSIAATDLAALALLVKAPTALGINLAAPNTFPEAKAPTIKPMFLRILSPKKLAEKTLLYHLPLS